MSATSAQPAELAEPGHCKNHEVELLLAISSEAEGGLSDDLDRILELATRFIDATFGIVSRVVEDAYFIEHIHQPPETGIEVGQSLELGNTYCAITLEAHDVVSIEEMRTSEHSGHPCYECFGLESYIGVPLRVEGAVYGTLNFSSSTPRPQPWTERDRQLVRLVARWVESSISQTRLHNRLAAAVDSLDQLNRELAQRNEDLDSFAHVASHDLQAPLRKLVGFTTLLTMDLGDDLTDCAARDLRLIQEEACRMQNLVQELLAFSSTGRARIDGSLVELDDCVDAALDVLQEILADTGAEIIRSPLPAVRGQATLLTQVFQNLIGNAVKFQRPDATPRIEIGADQDGDTARVSVSDNGIGIDAENSVNIFAPFQRLHASSEFEGTGLGLAICHKIVSRHRGEIRAEPSPSGGSTFILSFELEH